MATAEINLRPGRCPLVLPLSLLLVQFDHLIRPDVVLNLGNLSINFGGRVGAIRQIHSFVDQCEEQRLLDLEAIL